MWHFLTKKVSTITGIIVLLLVVSFVGWLILKEYEAILKTHFEPLVWELPEK